jgi:hypothetical protein
MTAPTPKTERGLLVAAVRQLLTDGWNLRRMLSPDGAIALHYDEMGIDATPTIIIADHLRGVRQTFCPESMAQAATYLVAAGILPRRFAFWSPPLPVKPMHVPADCPLCSDDLVSEVQS